TFVGPPSPGHVTDEGGDRQQEFDDMRVAIEREITDILDQLESVSFGSIGVFGFLVFLFGTTGLLTTIQTTFDSIFGRVGVRPAYKRIPLYYSILTLGPVVLIGGQWVQDAVIRWIGDGGWTAWLAGPLVVLSPVLTAWLLLYVMFVALPSTPVKSWAAAIGSFISAACWVLGMELFGLYVSKTAVSSLYGALALLPLSLLWIFIIWQLLLLGMQFTVALQALAATGRLPRPLAEIIEPEELSAGWTLEYAARIAAAFESGETITSGQLQRHTGLPNQISETILEALTDAGIVRCVDSDGSYTMARPSNEVTVTQLVALHRSEEDGHTLVVTDEMTLRARFREGGTLIFGEETLADLARSLGPKLKVVESMDRIQFGPFEVETTE
ncbi:MAG: membrane protein, partial [Myxococcota bacterium]